MSLKRDYKTKTDDEKELEPLGGPKSPDKESKTNGVQFGEYFIFVCINYYECNSGFLLPEFAHSLVEEMWRK